MRRRQRVCGIYKITSPSGKCYVGSSAHIHKRLNEHRGYFERGDHYNAKLRNAARKHGAAAMQFSIVVECSRDVLRDLEQLAIDHIQPEYNLERTVGKVLHDYWKCPDWSARNAERAGRELKERWKKPEFREKMLRVMREADTPERRKKASEHLKAKWQDPEFVKAAKQRSAAVAKKLFECPEYRKKHSEMRSRAMREQLKDPEFRRRRDEVAKEVNKRPVYCITLDRYFPSIGEAAESLGVSRSVVSKQFRGLKTRAGWQWRYLTDEELVARGYDPTKVRRDMPPPDRNNPGRTGMTRPVLCVELGIWFRSTVVASESFGCGNQIPSAIHKRGKAFGYSWRYAEKGEEIGAFFAGAAGDLAHKRFDSRCRPVLHVESGVVYPSARDAAKELGLGDKAFQGIYDVLRGKRSIYAGSGWAYADGAG